MRSIFTYLNKDNTGIMFEFLDSISYQNEEYVVLLPYEDTPEAGEAIILRVQPNENSPIGESYVGVESEDTMNAVIDIFREKFKDEFEFV